MEQAASGDRQLAWAVGLSIMTKWALPGAVRRAA